MSLSQHQAADLAVADLARRQNLKPEAITVARVENADFPNGVLGAPVEGEMATMMITPGWRLILRTDEGDYEYRANARQVRLFRYRGSNYKIYP